jgi:hypothetical protein
LSAPLLLRDAGFLAMRDFFAVLDMRSLESSRSEGSSRR